MTHGSLLSTRRDWLRLAGLGAAGTAGALLLPAPVAHAGDYRAIVCVFLYGGNDGLNMVVPTDTARHAQYSDVRANVAIPRGKLLRLTGSNYGLHPALAALVPAWDAGQLAPVFNVGPLHAPTSKAQFRAATENSALIPDNLYSHSDQQALWESGGTDALTRSGWGGRAAEGLGMKNPVIAIGGSGLYGITALRSALELPGPGSTFGTHELAKDDWRLSYAPLVARAKALRAMYTHGQGNDPANAYVRMQRDAFAMADRLGAIVKTRPGDSNASAAINSGFAPLISGGNVRTSLGSQLYQVAKLVAANAKVGGSRQIFFVQQGGYDTHGDQVAGDPTQGSHATLLKELGDALGAFHAAMDHLGMGEAVTSFTESEFGRTFKPNKTAGTDHAWGNHQLVLGGSVKGGTYGKFPALVLGGDNDVGVDSWELQGRWIPTTSVDQYAATLLDWLGASDSQLDAVLPNLANFGTKRVLGFL